MVADKRYIPILVIRPLAPIPFDVKHFTPADIEGRRGLRRGSLGEAGFYLRFGGSG